MKRIIIITLSLLLIANFVAAANEGTTGAQFLKILVGGKATAMGGAFVAIADDASALYYNPAGIATLSKMSIMLNYVKWPADINYTFFGFVYPMGGITGSVGFQAGFLTMPSMDVTTVEEPEGTGEKFSATDFEVGGTYARNFTDKLSIGFSGKFISQTIADASASMFAFDAGALYNTGFKSLRIGMSIRNFGSEGQFTGGQVLSTTYTPYSYQTPVNVSYITEAFQLPMNFNFGIAYDFLEGPANYLTTTLEFQNPNDGTENMRVGLEYNYSKMIFVRLGYILNYDKLKPRIDNMSDLSLNKKLEDLSAGIGFKYNLSGIDVIVDYSYTEMGLLSDQFVNGHRVGLTLAF